MPAPVIGAVAAPLVGALAGKIIGPKGGGASANVPRDVQGLRQNQISMLNSFLQSGDKNMFLNNMFGGQLTNGLQRQAGQYFQNYVGMQRPEQRTLDALTPYFQRNLAMANQSGGRFGSANAIMRSRAVDDWNMLGASISQNAQKMQMDAASQLAMLGQQDITNRVGLMQDLYRNAMGAAFQVPITTTPSGAQQGAQLGAGIGQGIMGAMPYLMPNQIAPMPQNMPQMDPWLPPQLYTDPGTLK